jgi:environmental stress-induced protein Ves
MPLKHLPAAQHAAAPWKNGLGVSQVIAADPPGADYGRLRWQVSSTGIPADCPFSLLPGLDRWFMVIEGPGVELTSIDDHGATRRHPVLPLRPYGFRGDWKTDCRLLAGPVKVLNLMARRGKAAGTLGLLEGKTLLQAAGETAIAVHLSSLDAWMLQGANPGKEEITPPSGPVALIRIRNSPTVVP